jgi:RNA polymerase primary sigma factor
MSPLPRERERSLVAAAAQGDQAACDQLVAAFTPLLAGVARRYAHRPGVDRAEVIQEGVVGLLEALRRFDPELDTPFWAYAVWWVRRRMQRLVAHTARPVVLSDLALRKLADLRDARTRLRSARHREPSSAELVGATGLCRDEVERLLAADRRSRGLDEPAGGDDRATVSESIADPVAQDGFERVAEAGELRLLRTLAAQLADREREVVSSRYGFGCPVKTLREVGDLLDLSAEGVRKIEQRALTQLRDGFAAAAASCGDARS